MASPLASRPSPRPSAPQDPITRRGFGLSFPTLFAALCGAAWGLGLARTLALSLHSALFHRAPGALLAAVLGAAAALAWHRLRPERPTLALSPLLFPLLDLLAGDAVPWRGPVLLVGGLALAVTLARRREIPRRWGLALALLVPLAVYLLDLSPYVGRADTFEFQVVGPSLGIAHPSGYPLYVLVSKLFSLLPLGSVAWRVNLSSAVFAALASAVMFWALSEGENQQFGNPKSFPLLALCAALILAFSPTLWSRAVEAEVYALNALVVVLGLWLAQGWATNDVPARRALPLFGLLTGVAMASHLTLGALALLAAPLILTSRPKLRTLALAAALGLAGLALYLYIPLRWPAVTGQAMSAAHFLRFVTNAESGGALRPWAFAQDPARWALVLRLLRAQVGWVGLALALIGLVRLLRRRWPLALGTLLAFGAWIWFNLSFYVAEPDYSAFLIPAHVVLVYWLGQGAKALAVREGASRQISKSQIQHPTFPIPHSPFPIPRSPFPIPHSPLTLLLALLALSQLWLTGPGLDTASVGRADEAWGRYALRQPLAQGAAILADSEKFPPLYYLQQIEGLRPDLELVTLFNEAQYREALVARLDAGQPVYMARYLPGLDAYGVSAAGPLVRVRPPSPPVPLQQEPEARFDGGPALNHHRLARDPEGRPMHHLTLVWHATQAVTQDLEVRLRLVDAAGATAWEVEATRPVAGYTTTQAWRAGTAIEDYHALRWPAWLPPGAYRLEVALFPRFGEVGLAVNEDGAWHALESVAVPAQRPGTLPQALDLRFGSTGPWLVGADLPGTATAGAPLALDLAWRRGHSDAAADARPLARWVDAGGQGRAMPLDSPALQPRETALRRATLTAPQTPGDYRLEIGWEAGGASIPARCAWLGPARAFCPVGRINVQPASVGLANFDGRISLLEAKMDAGAVPAGGQLAVDLRWRALRSMAQDYTVFVQVIGPEGKLHGQADSWPVQGTRPTSGWESGETLDDAYRFYVEGDGPPGTYRVIVGWYLLADMSRLPVVDAQGKAQGNFYQVGTFKK